MTLVLGVDSSTQSTKAVLVDAHDGAVLAERSVPHPAGTAVDPRRWLEACDDAVGDWLGTAAAVAVGGQQHGMVALDAEGAPVHDALLWNDTRSAGAIDAQECGRVVRAGRIHDLDRVVASVDLLDPRDRPLAALAAFSWNRPPK